MTDSTLPGAPFLARQGADLWLDGVRLADLAAEHGTPLFVYSRGAMRAAAAAYQRALAGRPHLLCYAMKANASLAVLKTFAEAIRRGNDGRSPQRGGSGPPAQRWS